MTEIIACGSVFIIILVSIWISSNISVMFMSNLFDLLNIKNKTLEQIIKYFLIIVITYLFTKIQFGMIIEIITVCFIQLSWNPIIAIIFLVIYVLIGISSTGLRYLR